MNLKINGETCSMNRIHHIGIYVSCLETVKNFFIDYFGAVAGRLYHNSKTGLSTYFLTFGDGSQLELLNRSDIVPDICAAPFHLSVSVGSTEEVDRMTDMLVEKGYRLMSGSRHTGDGYYESVISGPESILIEITE